VRSVRVEVLDILAQDDVEVAWSGDQEVVEAFPAQGADEAFGDRVAPSRRLPLIPTVGPGPSG
jgi:hypothetical protein